MKTLLTFLVVVSLSLPAFAGVAPVNNSVTVTSPEVVVDARSGHQEDPHISGNLVAYSDLAGVVPSSIRYYDLTTGSGSEITDPFLDRFDFVPDIQNGQIVFTRVTRTSADIYLYDTATQTSQELSPSVIDRTGAVIGGDTVVWVETHPDPVFTWRWIVAVLDVPSSTVTPLSTGPYDQSPAVSPDGNVVVWVSCDTLGEPCAVQQATRDVSGWTTTTLVPPGKNLSAATDGAIVGYTSIRNGEPDIYWQPIGGGPETQLSLPGYQQNPSISDGLAVFESNAPGNFDIYAYDTITSTLYRLTTHPADDFLPDVEVIGDTATVVYTSFNGTDNDVRAISFDLNRPSSIEQQMIDLRAAVASSGNQLTKALDAKLRATEHALSIGDIAAACSSLQDFINHVTAQRGKKISIGDADAWILSAQQIRTSLGCP